MLLCNLCETKIRLNFPRKELRKAGGDRSNQPCGVCRQKRYCTEYELVEKAERPPEEA